MKVYTLVFFLLTFVLSSYAQLDYRGWKTWGSLSTAYKLNKKSKIEGMLASRNRYGLTTLDQFFIDFNYSKEIKKRQEVSLGYRLVYDNKGYKNELVNRLNIDYSYQFKLNSKHFLIIRNRIQSKLYIGQKVSLIDRVRGKYTYKYTKKMNVYLFYEAFLKLDSNLLFYKYRIGTSINYKLYKRLKLGLKYILINDINIYEPKSFNVLSIALKKVFN